MKARAAVLLVSATVVVCSGGVSAAPSKLLQSVTPEFQQSWNEGLVALYSLDYATARSRFEGMRTLLPHHPAGYLYGASCLWLETLYAQRRIQSSLYNDRAFYAPTSEKVDPMLDRRFRELLGESLKRVDAALALDRKDPEALYFKGTAYGLLAAYESTVARSFFGALKNGLKAVKTQRETLKVDPSFADAYLSIGLYDYVLGNRPFIIKFLVALWGYRGSRERGIQELETAAAKGRYNGDEARTVLIALYIREKRLADALRLVEQLASKYPRNALFALERAGVLVRLGRGDEGFSGFALLLKDPSASNIGDLAHFQYGASLASRQYHAEALAEYLAVTRLPSANRDLVTRSHLRAAQILDLLKRRSEALAHYRIVLQRENVFDSREQAKLGIDAPYRGPK